MEDPFQILGLRRSWRLSGDEIRAAQRRCSIASHPDRRADPAGRARALQATSRVNSAASELLDPLTRGDAILRALEPDPRPSEPKQDPVFLARIMELREAVDEAGDDSTARGAVASEIDCELREIESDTEAAMEALTARQDADAWIAAFESLNRLRAMRRARAESAR